MECVCSWPRKKSSSRSSLAQPGGICTWEKSALEDLRLLNKLLRFLDNYVQINQVDVVVKANTYTGDDLTEEESTRKRLTCKLSFNADKWRYECAAC